MDPELVKALVVDGGSLAIFVIFVLYLTKQQAAERKTYLDVITKTAEAKETTGQSNMTLGLASLDKVNGNIHELVAVNIELAKAMAVHDVGNKAGQDHIVSGMSVVISKLDDIRDRLMVSVKDG